MPLRISVFEALKLGATKTLLSGLEKGVFLEKGSFQKSSFSRDSREYRDSRVSRKHPDCGKQIGSDHFQENLEILDILEIPPVKDPFRSDPFFRSLSY